MRKIGLGDWDSFFNKQSPILAQYSVSFTRININQRQFVLINIIQLCLTLVWIWRNGEKKENDIESSHKLRFVNYYIFADRRHRPYFNIWILLDQII